VETINNETVEIESEALTDSRTYEKTSYFLGIPLIIIFGLMCGKYESIFSI